MDLYGRVLSRSKSKYVWIGPIVGSGQLSSSEATSPAANHWQARCVETLLHLGRDIHVLTYCPQRSWPFGPFIGEKFQLQTEFDFIADSISYLNFPFIRNISLFLGLFFRINSLNCDYIITYNPIFSHRLVARSMQFFGRQWISIVADDLEKGSPDVTLFLSYDYFIRSQAKKKLCFHGGVDAQPDMISDEEIKSKRVGQMKILLYAGSISKWTGIEDFAKLFKEIYEIVAWEVHIYGKGEFSDLNQLVEECPSIKLFGLVDESELSSAMSLADAFVNPRPFAVTRGDNNFPSKVLAYLSYHKPILSTWTKGLSPEFREVLTLYKGDDKADLLDRLSKLESQLDSIEHQSKLKNFAKSNSWPKVVQRMLRKLV